MIFLKSMEHFHIDLYQQEVCSTKNWKSKKVWNLSETLDRFFSIYLINRIFFLLPDLSVFLHTEKVQQSCVSFTWNRLNSLPGNPEKIPDIEITPVILYTTRFKMADCLLIDKGNSFLVTPVNIQSIWSEVFSAEK